MSAPKTLGPICHGRPMWKVVSLSTSANAYDRTKDTPVWWCPECHRQIKRDEATQQEGAPQ